MKIKILSKFEKSKKYIALDRLNMPAKSSLYFTASNLIAKGASFLFTPVFTRLLTAEEYGEYSLFSSYLSIAVVIITLEMPGSIIMRAFQKKRGLEHISVITAFFISLLLSFPTVLLMYLFLQNGSLTFRGAYLFLLITLISLSFINLYISKCKFLYNWRPPFAVAIIQSVLTPALSVGLIVFSGLDEGDRVGLKIGTSAVISSAVALFLLIVSVWRAYGEAKSLKIEIGHLKSYLWELTCFLLKLSIPLLPYYFSVMLISQTDKLFISSYLGREALGKYSVAYSAGVALTALTSGFMSALCPWIMRKVRAGETLILKKALELIIRLTLPVILIFLCISPEIFGILAPIEYKSALPVLFIISIVPLFLAVSQSLCSIAIAKEKTVGVIISGIIPAVLSLFGNIFFINLGKLFIPAIITALSYLVLMLCETVNVGKILGKSPLNVSKTLQSILLFALVSSVIFLFADIFIARTIILIPIAAYLLYMLKGARWLLNEKCK